MAMEKFPIYTTTKGIVDQSSSGPLFYEYECDGCGGSYSCPHYYFKEENRTWILHAVLPNGVNMVVYCHGDKEFQYILEKYSGKLEGVPFAITFEEYHTSGQKLFCNVVQNHQNIHELAIGHGDYYDISKVIEAMPALKKVDCLIRNFNKPEVQPVLEILKNEHIEEFIMHHFPNSTFWSYFCSALASSKTLKKFSLLSAPTTFDLSQIGSVLESNATLNELNIVMFYPNYITGTDAVLRSLKSNSTLETLSISLRTEKEFELFREMIKINTTLKSLYVFCYSWQYMDGLWDGIGQNNGLVKLHLKYPYDINGTMSSLKQAITKNVGIKTLLVNDKPVAIDRN